MPSCGFPLRRHARLWLKRKLELPPDEQKPALWVAVSDGKGTSPQLRPVCEHPGHLHVGAIASDDEDPIFSEVLAKEEVQLLNLVADGVRMCSAVGGGGDGSAGGAASGGGDGSVVLRPLLVAQPTAVTSALRSVWSPSLRARVWLCEDHLAEHVQPGLHTQSGDDVATVLSAYRAGKATTIIITGTLSCHGPAGLCVSSLSSPIVLHLCVC